jgi:hypothetical protein
VTLALSKIIIVPILQQNIDYFRDFYRLLFIVFSHYDKFQSWRSSQAPNSTTLKLPTADELWCGGGDSVTAM